MAKELSNGLMVQNIMENGRTIKCMVKENSVGLMDVYIKVTIRTTRNMVKVFILGQMAECIKEDFIMVITWKRPISLNQRLRSIWYMGKREKEYHM